MAVLSTVGVEDGRERTLTMATPLPLVYSTPIFLNGPSRAAMTSVQAWRMWLSSLEADGEKRLSVDGWEASRSFEHSTKHEARLQT